MQKGNTAVCQLFEMFNIMLHMVDLKNNTKMETDCDKICLSHVQ